MPIPVSVIETSAAVPTRPTRTSTSPPVGIAWRALISRFIRACLIAVTPIWKNAMQIFKTSTISWTSAISIWNNAMRIFEINERAIKENCKGIRMQLKVSRGKWTNTGSRIISSRAC